MIGAFSRPQRSGHPPAGGRLALVAVMLLAFVFQAYLTQTHIHKGDPFDIGAQSLIIHVADSKAASGQAVGNQGTPSRDNFPANDDPANCPICQQIMQAGLFVAPVWLVPLLVSLAVSTVEIATIVAPHYDTVSHSWRGRGPPRI